MNYEPIKLNKNCPILHTQHIHPTHTLHHTIHAHTTLHHTITTTHTIYTLTSRVVLMIELQFLQRIPRHLVHHVHHSLYRGQHQSLHVCTREWGGEVRRNGVERRWSCSVLYIHIVHTYSTYRYYTYSTYSTYLR
jgi:hypothetical protein